MPHGSYTLFRVERFPNLDALRNSPLIATGNYEEISPEHPDNTELHYMDEFQIEGYVRLEMVHRTPQSVEGWYHDEWVSRVIAEERFPCYYSELDHLFIAKAPRDVANSGVNKLNSQFFDTFALWSMRTDLAAIIPTSPNIKSAWFGNTRHTNIRSEACHGDVIQTDNEFARLANYGDLTALRLECQSNGLLITTIISAKGSVFFHTEPDIVDRFDILRFVRGFSQ